MLSSGYGGGHGFFSSNLLHISPSPRHRCGSPFLISVGIGVGPVGVDRPRKPAFAMATSIPDGGGLILREVLTREGRVKLNPSPDGGFYALPRFVTHVDDVFLQTLTDLYRELIPEGGEVLDLMSSWVSHLPPEVAYSKVVGHGLNAAELSRNKRLDYFFVRDLNQDPHTELADRSFDAVLCTVSVQYLQHPERVFAEIYRLLKPGGVCIVSFSNRMFYEKAIAAWRDGTPYSRTQLVSQYFLSVSGFTQPQIIKKSTASKAAKKNGIDKNLLISFLQNLLQPAGKDPFYAVVAYRNFKPVR